MGFAGPSASHQNERIEMSLKDEHTKTANEFLDRADLAIKADMPEIATLSASMASVNLGFAVLAQLSEIADLLNAIANKE